MQVIVNDNSDKNKVLSFIDRKQMNDDEKFHLINTYPPDMRDWLKSSGIYDREIESNRVKSGVFENIISSNNTLVLINNSLPNCEARLSFDLITLVLTQTELPMMEIDDGMTALSLGDSVLLINSRIVVIQSDGVVCYILNFQAIMGLNEHINIDFNELVEQIDLDDY
ncbi:MAG: hypothetical protein JXL97_00745 [Bacteroidales bacterium]|nr:hypothetical protein [Bacteroidales bacterium]